MKKSYWFGLGLAFELTLTALGTDYYVAQNGQTPGDFKSWETAATNIQDAVNATLAGDTVWVTNGIYRAAPRSLTNVVSIGKSLSLRGCGPRETVIIDGENARRGIHLFSATTWLLEGLTISNCTALEKGGGIYLFIERYSGSSGTLRNCIVIDNKVAPSTSVSAAGGGLYADTLDKFSYTISNCVFRNNQALSVASLRGKAGAAFLSTYTGGGTIADTLFEGNQAHESGGALHLGYGNPHILERCAFVSNTIAPYTGSAAQSGGAVNVEGGDKISTIMRNCLLYNNRSVSYGGAVGYQSTWSRDRLFDFYNCTFVSNYAAFGGANIYVRQREAAQGYSPMIRLYNSIVMDGYYNSLSLATDPDRTNLVYNSCFVPGNIAKLKYDPSNIHVDPMFVDAKKGDFHLRAISPCINVGTNQTWMIGTADLDGNPRIDRLIGQVDMGCYEKVVRGTTIMIR